MATLVFIYLFFNAIYPCIWGTNLLVNQDRIECFMQWVSATLKDYTSQESLTTTWNQNNRPYVVQIKSTTKGKQLLCEKPDNKSNTY